ncbi:hypothetical protein [Rathayibacter sp. VKM Ac-2926]|nr:hypothetical protein [Rathayibacter sp. VKM Ac-2926]MCJ1703838.1 hypothetical protein [Rathayibacter sp. VKM Ac-2926]
MSRFRRLFGLAAAAALAATLVAPTLPASAAGNTLVVDASTSIGPVTRVGAGGL